MRKTLSSFLSLFQKKDSPNTDKEKEPISKKELGKISKKNGRLFFELPYSDLDKMMVFKNYFFTTFSSSEMLRNWNYRSINKRFPNKKYSIVLIPITEVENPKERLTKKFIEIATKDYGEESVNNVVGELGPAIASFLTPEELKENNIKTIIVPHIAIPDLDENCLFIIEQNDDEKNSLMSFESYGYRGWDNLWENGDIYLAFVTEIEK